MRWVSWQTAFTVRMNVPTLQTIDLSIFEFIALCHVHKGNGSALTLLVDLLKYLKSVIKTSPTLHLSKLNTQNPSICSQWLISYHLCCPSLNHAWAQHARWGSNQHMINATTNSCDYTTILLMQPNISFLSRTTTHVQLWSLLFDFLFSKNTPTQMFFSSEATIWTGDHGHILLLPEEDSE